MKMTNKFIAYRPFEKRAVELLNKYLPVPIVLLSLLLAYYGEHPLLLIIFSIIFILYNLYIKKLKTTFPDKSQALELTRNALNGIVCLLFSYFVGNSYQGYLFCIPLLFAIPFTFKFIPTLFMVSYTLFCSVLGYLITTKFVLFNYDKAFILGLIIFCYLSMIGVKVLRTHFVKMDLLNENLKNEITKRKQTEITLQNAKESLEKAWNQLKTTQMELIENAHKAGMADIVTRTLHDIGNLLNSVKASSQIIMENQNSAAISGLKNANKLLSENIDDLENFIIKNPKGNKLMRYYLLLDEMFDEEKNNTVIHINRLIEKTDSITKVLAAQQNYDCSVSLTEQCNIIDIIDDAIVMQQENLSRFDITIMKDFQAMPRIPVQKTKLIQILVNLIKNGKDAMMETPPEKRKLTIASFSQNKNVYIKINDTGEGIVSEYLNKIFTHGYTTKEGYHGFGLHTCANNMTEMGGRMWAESDGENKGATFVLEFSL